MAATIDPTELAEVPLFRGLTPAALTELAALLRRRAFGEGAAILRAEEPGEVAYVVRDGYVRVEADQVDGGCTILAILGPGEVVGELSLIDRLGRSATVVAHEPTTLYGIDRAAFWACLRTMPAVTYNLVGLLSRRLRLADAHVQALATLDVEARVARQLLALTAEHGEADGAAGVRLPFRLTQGDLAGLVGASRVRVNQVLRSYRQRGVVSVDPRQRITVHDPDALAERCRGSRAPAAPGQPAQPAPV